MRKNGGECACISPPFVILFRCYKEAPVDRVSPPEAGAGKHPFREKPDRRT